jgi:hypothetical protein
MVSRQGASHFDKSEGNVRRRKSLARPIRERTYFKITEKLKDKRELVHE